MELLKSPKIMVTLAIALATVFVGWRMLYPRTQARNAALERQIAVAHERRNLLRDLRQEDIRYQELAQYLAPSGGSDWLMQTALAHAAKAGLRIAEIQPQPVQPVAGSELKRLALRLDARAETYHQVGQFVSLCEQHPEMIRIESLQLHGQDASTAGGPGGLSAQVGLAAFYREPSGAERAGRSAGAGEDDGETAF